MKMKDKIILIFLSVVTIGIYPLVVFSGKKNKQLNSDLSRTTNKIINIEELKTNLGGLDNIIGAEFTHTKVNIQIKERKLVEVENIQAMKGIEGVFANSKKITIIVGNSAKSVANQLVLE